MIPTLKLDAQAVDEGMEKSPCVNVQLWQSNPCSKGVDTKGIAVVICPKRDLLQRGVGLGVAMRYTPIMFVDS